MISFSFNVLQLERYAEDYTGDEDSDQDRSVTRPSGTGSAPMVCVLVNFGRGQDYYRDIVETGKLLQGDIDGGVVVAGPTSCLPMNVVYVYAG